MSKYCNNVVLLFIEKDPVLTDFIYMHININTVYNNKDTYKITLYTNESNISNFL